MTEGTSTGGVPNSIQPVLVSVTNQTVIVEIHVIDVEPISGWGVDVNFDPDALEFKGLAPGSFIPGQIALPNASGSLLKAGGAVMGRSDGFSGSGVLGTITFSVVGELPTSLQVSTPTLRGYDGETTVINSQINIDFNDSGDF